MIVLYEFLHRSSVSVSLTTKCVVVDAVVGDVVASAVVAGSIVSIVSSDIRIDSVGVTDIDVDSPFSLIGAVAIVIDWVVDNDFVAMGMPIVEFTTGIWLDIIFMYDLLLIIPIDFVEEYNISVLFSIIPIVGMGEFVILRDLVDMILGEATIFVSWDLLAMISIVFIGEFFMMVVFVFVSEISIEIDWLMIISFVFAEDFMSTDFTLLLIIIEGFDKCVEPGNFLVHSTMEY